MMEKITNLIILESILDALEPQLRTEIISDIEYMVIPAIALQEGVLNGVYYSKEDIRDAKRWDGVPVTVDHPKNDEGNHVTANSPDQFEKSTIGRVFNAICEDNKLKVELWLDIQRCNKLNENIIKDLQNNKMLEISTGFYGSLIKEESEFRDKKYVSKLDANSVYPDHLAILTQAKGACSIQDGCGALRVQQEELDQLTNISEEIKEEASDSSCVCEDNINNNLTYEGYKMKDKIISELISNVSSEFEPKDKLTLESLPEEILTKCYNMQLNCVSPEDKENLEKLKANQWQPEDKALFEQLKTKEQARKKQLMDKLIANNNELTETALAKMDSETLQILVNQFNSKNQQPEIGDYSGKAGAAPNSNERIYTPQGVILNIGGKK